MFVYATVVGNRHVYDEVALPGINRVAGEDAIVVDLDNQTDMMTAYNVILDEIAGLQDVDALILMHEDVDLLDGGFEEAVRSVFAADPLCAIAGVIGARGVRGMNWWDGEKVGSVTESRGPIRIGNDGQPVDTVDGLLMALSPWAIANLRYPSGVYPPGFHAYDAELCFQARQRGRTVRIVDTPVIHRTKSGWGNLPSWYAANDIFCARWKLGAPSGSARRSAG